VLVGEASGDILGSRVLSALKQHYDEVIVEGMGGPLMEAQGLSSMFPMERLSVMGIVEPLKRLPELLRMRRALIKHFVDNPPDLFLGIDSPDFNLYVERKLRAEGIKTAHLVSPSVWAWRGGRIHKIKRSVDLMMCLFPFETEIYRQHQIPVAFVGHPLADELAETPTMQQARESLGVAPEGKVLALLPGSRGGEVRLLAPLFLQAAHRLSQQHSDLSFLLPAANDQRRRELEQLLLAYPNLPVRLLDGQSRQAMLAADAVLLASGTATLEAMLLRRPMVVTYRMAALSWAIVSRLVTSKFIGLPNILAGRALVPELIQDEATPENMVAQIEALLTQPSARSVQLQEFQRLHQSLSLNYGQRVATALMKLTDGGEDSLHG
jgi:lipid-A-disaccharide synthase